MSRLMLLLMTIGLGLWIVQTLRQARTAAPARKAARADYFFAASALMTNLRQQIQPTGFARAAGRYRGLSFDLQAVPDTLTLRKLPALWVMITVTEPQMLTAETHIMARANGQESFSTFGDMPFEGNLPPGFPPDCTLRCTAPGALPDPATLSRIATLFGDQRLKEAVLSPKGLRLVVLAEEADRANYLIFRDAELGREAFPARHLETLLDALSDLHRAQSPLKALT